MRMVPDDGRLEAGDAAQQRGLPAPGRAEQGHDLARRDVERDAVEHGPRAVGGDEVADLEGQAARRHRPHRA